MTRHPLGGLLRSAARLARGNQLKTENKSGKNDAAGNMTFDATASISYAFDQENRLTGAATTPIPTTPTATGSASRTETWPLMTFRRQQARSLKWVQLGPSRSRTVNEMGRQIQFHMLPEDQKAFLRTVQERDPVVVTMRDSDSAHVEPIGDQEIGPDKTFCLWNRELLPHLEREWVPNPGYYRLDTLYKPILEFTPSFTATWEGNPALGQGRLFGNFESYLGKPQDFAKWYDRLVRWIRANYHKNPRGMGGYVGPGAYEFYKSGGYLLPNFLPPRTKEWLAVLSKQHPRSRKPSRMSKR